MRRLLDADDDWMEGVRRKWLPRLHPFIEVVGGYSVGTVYGEQYVGHAFEPEDVVEEALEERARRNPIACLKSLEDGRVSEGSWVVLHDDCPELVEPGMQLHITLFAPENDNIGRELYAHYEDDWRVRPFAHVREENFQPVRGAEMATVFFDEYTFLVLN